MSVRFLRTLLFAGLCVPVLAGIASAQPIPASPWVYEGGRPAADASRGATPRVAGLKKVPVLPDDYRIVKGGEITLEASQWLADTSGAMLIGGDALSLEAYKVGRPDMTVPVHALIRPLAFPLRPAR